MQVITVNSMPDGTKIQIEDWSEDYSFMAPASTLVAYPVAKTTSDRQFGPSRNKTFRLAFSFESDKETKKAYEDLIVGVKQLIDFKEYTDQPELFDFL